MPNAAEDRQTPLIMLFDDDSEFVRALGIGLRAHGFDVDPVSDLAAAERSLRRKRKPDAVILDIVVDQPTRGNRKDGVTLYRSIRQQEARARPGEDKAQARPVLVYFLTSLKDADKRLQILPEDVESYFRKPVLPSVLAERLWQDLGRGPDGFRHPDDPPQAPEAENPPAASRTIVAQALRLDPGETVCRWQGSRVALSESDFRIVQELVRQPGTVRSQDQLADAAQSSSAARRPDVTTRIKRIRQSFRKVDPDFDRIESLYRVGYRWNCS